MATQLTREMNPFLILLKLWVKLELYKLEALRKHFYKMKWKTPTHRTNFHHWLIIPFLMYLVLHTLGESEYVFENNSESKSG